MTQYAILINFDKKSFEQIHELMGMKIEVNDIIVYQMYEGKSKQQFYREIMREGIKAKLFQFEKKKREIEDESKDSH